jgi:hypothetical protein
VLGAVALIRSRHEWLTPSSAACSASAGRALVAPARAPAAELRNSRNAPSLPGSCCDFKFSRATTRHRLRGVGRGNESVCAFGVTSRTLRDLRDQGGGRTRLRGADGAASRPRSAGP